MQNEDHISEWIKHLHQGGDPNEGAGKAITDEYLSRLVGLARVRLGDLSGAVEDEEDAALSALRTYFRWAKTGRYIKYKDRDGLWRLLAAITCYKVSAIRRRANTQKRKGPSGEADPENVLGNEPSPEFVAEYAETINRVLKILDDDVLRQVFLMRFDNYKNHEIAKHLDLTVGTIEYKNRRIRELAGRQSAIQEILSIEP